MKMSDLTTRQRILDEAEKLFIENGIADTQMKDIAAAVNINRRTLYRYFPTKDHLTFEIEITMLRQIKKHLTLDSEEITRVSGYEKIKTFFEYVNLEDIKKQVRFTAEFDRYYQKDYPTPELQKLFIEFLNPNYDPLYHYICEGINDGSIRDDMTAKGLYQFISQSFLALFQRLILRENHLKYEYCDNIDFHNIFREIILSGIKSKSS